MGRMKETIPDNYSCIHYLDVEHCHECMYAMQTAHIPDWRRPSMSKWFNNFKNKITRKWRRR